jgi:3',5'-cyclic AMP phosphodiesterase CpdA
MTTDVPIRRTAILHISDIHRTPDEKVSNSQILHSLKTDLTRHEKEGIPRANIVVLSGDITQSGTKQEFAEAREFLESLLDHLGLSVTALVLVPGNHDVHWPTSREAFIHHDEPPGDQPEHLVIPLRDGYLCAKSEDAYQALG